MHDKSIKQIYKISRSFTISKTFFSSRIPNSTTHPEQKNSSHLNKAFNENKFMDMSNGFRSGLWDRKYWLTIGFISFSRRDLYHEQFTRRDQHKLRGHVPANCPTNSDMVWNRGTSRRDQILVSATGFSSENGWFTRGDLVPWTSSWD